jgi:hypothetical protein
MKGVKQLSKTVTSLAVFMAQIRDIGNDYRKRAHDYQACVRKPTSLYYVFFRL